MNQIAIQIPVNALKKISKSYLQIMIDGGRIDCRLPTTDIKLLYGLGVNGRILMIMPAYGKCHGTIIYKLCKME